MVRILFFFISLSIIALLKNHAVLVPFDSLDIDEVEGCLMLDADKIGRSATGSLVRSRNKTITNPFPEGVELIKKAHEMGVHFSYTYLRT